MSNAPGAPGIAAKWTSSSKAGIGKALDAAADVVFTIGYGILNEVYYPREDIPCIRDLGLLVTNGKNFLSEKKRDTDHEVSLMGEGVPAYQIINTCTQNKYRITKEIIVDPLRHVVLQKINFTALSLDSFHLYALLSPHLNNNGDNNSGWCGQYKGVPMLFAQHNGLCLALACSADFLKRSVGYVGASDGWTDLSQHKEMQWEFTQAENGNIALTGELAVSQNTDLVLALGFGRNPDEAASNSRASLLEGFASAKKLYIDGWRIWLGKLKKVEGENFRISASVLRMNEAKSFPGGILASLSIPWGQTKGDKDKIGYHLVWPRDLVETAGGFMALDTKEDALRITNYLMSTQKENGSWPQNMWLEGSPFWKGKQLDQTALPLLLVDKCNHHKALEPDRMQRYWPGLKKAITYLISNGPYTEQDRWEEEQGYTPFTLAAVIAGLLAAADLAEINQEKELADYCRQTADVWNDQIDSWLYVTGTPLAKAHAVEGYYIRINPYYDIPAQQLGEKYIHLKNHDDKEGWILINQLISVDALALVRFGLRAPDDPKILNTLKVIDAELKVDTPAGPCWHRYNLDGYGEDKNGNPYEGVGIGRAWPLLTGERAHYEIAAGNLENAKALLKTMDNFSNNGLLPEQIWDTADIPNKNLHIGKYSGSAMPLTWTHAEYIKLCASIRDNQVFDTPLQTQQRYIRQKTVSTFSIWRFSSQCTTIPNGKNLRVEVMQEAMVIWTTDEWKTTKNQKTIDPGIGVFIADLIIPRRDCRNICFTFFWLAGSLWEGKNFCVQINN